jgi:DNA-binding transcriptional LysR family regulator
MDIHQLRTFLAVIEAPSLTSAAGQLHLSPGAVSLQMHNLAAELRAELFVRSGRRIVPTAEAFRLAEHARAVIAKMHEIQHDFANEAAGDSRPFHFATGATTLIHRLGRPLRTLRKRFPRADIHVTVAPTETMVAGLLDRRFDLVLLSLPWPQQDLNIFPLFEEELLVLRPSKRQVTSGAVGVIQPAEMARARFLLYPKSSNMRSIIERYFDDLGIRPQVVMEADDTEAIKRLVEAGFGYSILPQFALRGRRRFQTLRVAGQRLVRQQALAMAKTDYPRALTVAIARFLESALAPPERRGP